MIIADRPILLGSRWYNRGEALPGDSPLVDTWIKNGVAHFDNPKVEAPQEGLEPVPDPEPEPVPQEDPEKKATKRGKK